MKARLPQGYGSNNGGINNINQLAKQAQKIQEDMERIEEELKEKEYTTTAGGNAVTVTVYGRMEVKSIDIKPEAVDPEDTEMLSDMVIAAVNEALRMAAADKEAKLNAATGGFTIPGML